MASGEIPRQYEGRDVSPAMVAAKVVEGKRPDLRIENLGLGRSDEVLKRPENACVKELKELIERCWNHDPNARPKFWDRHTDGGRAELLEELKEMLERSVSAATATASLFRGSIYDDE